MNRFGIVALLVLAITAAFTAHLAPLASASWTIFGYAFAFLPYVAVLWCIRKHHFEGLAPLVVAALGIRALLLFADPLLSDDIFRYVWEGRVTAAGFNPFVLAPDAEALSHLRDDVIWPAINHPSVPAIYPPVSQYVFAFVALLGGGTVLMKLMFVLAEVAGVLAVWKLWSADDARKLFAFALYALNPLVMLEVAWSGHLDVLAWIPLAVALLAVVERPPTAKSGAIAGAMLGVSIGAKILGLLFLPYLLLRDPWNWRGTLGHRFAIVLVALGVAAGSYAGFAGAGGKLFQGFGTYAASWRSNDGLFRGFDSLSFVTLQNGAGEERIFTFEKWNEAAMEYGFTKEWQGQELPNTSFATNQISQTVGKVLALLIVGLVMLWCIVAVRDPIIAAIALLLTLYFVAPTVHPWYVAWLVPLAALRPSPTVLAFSGATLAAYVAWMSHADGGAWSIPWWVVAVEYGMVAAVLIWEVGARSGGFVESEEK